MKCFVDDTNGYWATYEHPKIILICATDTELLRVNIFTMYIIF